MCSGGMSSLGRLGSDVQYMYTRCRDGRRRSGGRTIDGDTLSELIILPRNSNIIRPARYIIGGAVQGSSQVGRMLVRRGSNQQ